MKQKSQRRLKVQKGGYRPILVDQETLVKESQALEPLMKVLNGTTLSDQDKVSYYTLIYASQRYPKNFLESWNPIVESSIQVESELLENLNLSFENKNVIARLEQNNIKTLFDVVNCFNFHSAPYAARFSLANWYLGGKFDLVLFYNKIPSSKQVLKLQAMSKRCISLIANKLDSLVMGERDPFSFLLHDLVHAYKMFSNDYLLSGQIGFYRALLKLFQPSNTNFILDKLLESDKEFVDQFDYLISDMNSHPRHLFFYFKAILILAFKRRFGVDETSRLADRPLEEFDEMFETILDRFEMSEDAKQIARDMIHEKDVKSDKIQKPSNTIDFAQLDNFFLSLS